MTTAGAGFSTERSTEKAVEQALKTAMQPLRGQPATIGFLFASAKHNLTAALTAARKQQPETQFIACHTAGEFTQKGVTDGGIATLLVHSPKMIASAQWSPAFGKDATFAGNQLAMPLKELAAKAQSGGARHSTTVLLMDGMQGNSETLLKTMMSSTRAHQQFAGARAGDDGAFKQTATGANTFAGMGGIAALHVFDEKPWGMGVEHGYQQASRIFKVTRSDKNNVIEIDGKPAIEVYREHAKALGVTLDSQSAGAFFVRHLIGLVTGDKVQGLRAATGMLPNGGLTCTTEMPEGTYACIVKAQPQDLLASAAKAAEEAKKNLAGRPAAAVLLFDCVGRRALLGPKYNDEVAAVANVFPGVPLAGFFSYAEVARYAGRLNGIHGGTAVITAIPA